MKCPKCNYVSFDFNQACPKCKKELGEVREKMNYFSFKPSPPEFSGLVGNRATETVTMLQKTGSDIEETTELDFSDSLDFDMSSDSLVEQNQDETSLELPFDEASDELSLEFDDFDMDDAAATEQQNEQTVALEDTPEAGMDFSFEDESDEISLDFDEPSIGDTSPEKPQTEDTAALEKSLEDAMDFSFEEESEETSLDFDGPSIGDAAPEKPQIEQEAGLENSVEESLELAFDEEFSEPEPATEVGETATDEDVDFDLKLDKEDDIRETVVLDPSEEDEVTTAFGLDDLGMSETGTDSSLEITAKEDGGISLDLEESISLSEENAEVSDSFDNLQEEQKEIDSSEFEVLDLDLDLDRAGNK